MPNRRLQQPDPRTPPLSTRESGTRILIGARVAVLGAVAMLSSACGESSSQGGGTGGAYAGAAGALGGSAGAMGGAPPSGGAFSVGGAGAAAGATSGGACHQNGEACTDSRDCCTTAVCNNTAGAFALNGCHQTCTQNSDCSTGCCVPLKGSTRGICAEAIWCGCGMSGAACGSQLPACCGDQICLANDNNRSSYACQKRCTTNADCPTMCCVSIPTLGMSACLDPKYCPAM